MANPLIVGTLAVLAFAMVYIGATQLGVCGDGISLLYFAAADAAGASAVGLS